MNYLLDTNHWSAIQRNDPVVIAHMQSLPEEARIFMPVIVQGELLVGIELGASEAKRERLQQLYEQVVAQAADVLPITPEIAEWYARIFAQLRRKGKPIPTNDIWIAAIALAHGLILVTSDEHFQHIDGLQVA